LPAGLLGAYGIEQRPRLVGVDDASPIHLARDLGRRPLERPDRVRCEKAWYSLVTM
jgi:hypothetical protein